MDYAILAVLSIAVGAYFHSMITSAVSKGIADVKAEVAKLAPKA